MTPLPSPTPFSPTTCCTVILAGGLCYEGLRVKKIMVTKTDTVYRVLVPCEGDCGANIMVAFDEEDVLRMRKSR